MTWGKVDPNQLPDTVTCYIDSTVALPLLTVYALARRQPRPLRRLMDRLEELTRQLADEYRARAKE
jgi:deoxyhypusine synthase